jgi:hypothetical protein
MAGIIYLGLKFIWNDSRRSNLRDVNFNIIEKHKKVKPLLLLYDILDPSGGHCLFIPFDPPSHGHFSIELLWRTILL